MNDINALLGRLSLDLDQRLSQEDKVLLESDLGRMPQHQALAAAVRDVDRMFRHEPLMAPRRDLLQDILAQVDQSQQRRDQRILGMTFVLGGFLSLAPLILLTCFLVFLAAAVLQPGLASTLIDTTVSLLGRVYGLTVLVGAVQRSLGGWVLPLLAASASLFLLTLSVVWAQRLQPLTTARLGRG